MRRVETLAADPASTGRAPRPTWWREWRHNGAVTSAVAETSVRLPFRPPLAAHTLLAWFEARAVDGVTHVDPAAGVLRRTLDLPGGPGRVTLRLGPTSVTADLELASAADEPVALARCRRLFDLEAEPSSIDAHLAADPALTPLVRARPGLRVPGTVDPHETALSAVIGQQISTAAARTIASRLTARLSPVLGWAGPGPDRLFPSVAAVADADLTGLGMPGRRAEAVRRLARALDRGEVVLAAGCDRVEARQRLLELPGIGPWTADYILLRALGDPDAFPATDLVLRQRLAERGLDPIPSPRWSPWRAYVAQHLWVSGPGPRTAGPARQERAR